MKNRTSLLLMEQLIMVLVFALGATLCLQLFVRADQLSRQSQQRDRAVVLAQSCAETIKGCSGDLSQAARLLQGQCADDELQLSDDGLCLLACHVPSDTPGLGLTQVQVADAENGQPLLVLTVAWQEVSG